MDEEQTLRIFKYRVPAAPVPVVHPDPVRLAAPAPTGLRLTWLGHSCMLVEIGGRRFAGWFAWLLWGLVYIMFLVGFRAKVAVMWNWIWNYLFSTKGARLITGSPPLEVIILATSFR